MDTADTDEAGLLERLRPRPLDGNAVLLLQSTRECAE